MNKYSNVLGIIPFKFWEFISLDIVYVFPEPVWPYNNIVPLYPKRVLSIIFFVVNSNISNWEESSENTLSK